MDRLEKIMKENKELFLDQEPPSGHLERFEQKLKKQNAKGRVIQLTAKVSRIAAVGLLVIMSSLWAYNQFGSSDEVQQMKLGEVNQKYKEVEYFFTSQINDKYQELQTVEATDESAYKETLFTELEQMDSIYDQLQAELGANPNDERIIQAMIMHYQTKLKVMSDILKKLNTYKEINDSQSNNQNQYESVKL